MTLSRRTLLGTAAAATTLPLTRRAHAQAPTLKIGVLNDLSGPYRDTGGVTSVICAKQAIEEYAAANGLTVEVLSADHQNKPDLAVSITRQWFDRDGVDVLMDVPTSSVALAVQSVVREKNKVFLAVGPASIALTTSQCSPNMITWVYDTYMLAKSTGGAMVKAGGNSWYFLTADYAFGKQLQADTTKFVQAAGGKVLGSAPYPFPGTTDFSSFLVQAQASGAKVLGLANAGGDTVNSIKQANEFGVNKSMKLAALLMFITDVHALGLATAKGLVLTESYYWDLNDGTRNFCNKIKAKSPNNWPNMIHAGCYSATLHYLKTAKEMGAAEAKRNGAATVARMKKLPVEDECFGKTTIRDDGRHLVPAYLFEVKTPAESHGPWDYFKLRGTTPADEAALPLSEGRCAFIGKA
ncbi:MAG TPA: ABC transporter substrate-binding protein [Acetobacteraceae bacterium]|nr:ABC transporter substrate-binding protein [Acetobacteraceae bacterium]